MTYRIKKYLFEYVPQVKMHWWSGWKNVGNGNICHQKDEAQRFIDGHAKTRLIKGGYVIIPAVPKQAQ